MDNMTPTSQSSRALNRAISATDVVWSTRARAIGCLSTETTGLESLPRRASTAFTNPLAMPLPGKRLTARCLSNPNCARIEPFLSRQRRDLSGRGTNFSGGIIQALRSLLTRYPLVPLLQETTCGRFQTFFFAPAFLSVPALHESNMQQEQDRDHGKSIHKHG